ncbi:MAG: beta-class carbonic anhydrase [Terriglobales bacterium]
MSAIDEALRANADYARGFTAGGLAAPPRRRLAILACMDARLAVHRMLGLAEGDAHVIRNAGGIVDADALRSLIVSHHELGTQEFMLIHHTGCGMLGLRDDALRARLRQATGIDADAPSRFYGFADLEADLREQMAKIRAHPWIPSSVTVRGFIFDVATGRLREVAPTAR